ncbi:hypothetical protein ACQ4PT_052565 [Festuca glaucescens]
MEEGMKPTLLSALSRGNESWTIKVKVLRLWDSINLSTNEVISADMILADKKVTLWGESLANMLNEDLLGKQTIVIVTSNLVKDFYGLSLQTTNASKIYLDLEIAETKQIINRHCIVDTFPTMIEVDASMQGTVEQQMFYNRKTLREITELRYSDEYICTTKATIDEIISDRDWWYMACIRCYCATKKESTNYVCRSCNKIAESAELRYIINIRISDDTTTTTCAIFNEVAQRLLGNRSVSTMLEQNGLSETIPEAIRNLCGRTLIFRLKLNSKNLEECMENYKVNYTFEPNDKLEMEYSNEMAEEIEAESDGETIIDDEVIGDVQSMEKLTHLQKPTIKKSGKRDISSNAENNDSIPKDECAEELHQEISSTTKKKNIESGNKRNMSSEKENIVAMNLNQDRPKRIRKTPDFFTY